MTVQQPEKFESDLGMDAVEWIERFELLSRLNGWDEKDQIALIQLYLGRKEMIWYRRNKDMFVSWNILRNLFEEKFESRESEWMAWNKIQKLKQQDFKSITNLEVELEELFIKAKIDDERVEFNCLLNCLEPRYKRRILETNIRTWKRAIGIIQDSEKLDAIMELDNTQEYRGVPGATVEKLGKKTIFKEHIDPATNEPMFETIFQKFGEASINLIAKMDQFLEKQNYKKSYTSNRNSETEEMLRRGQCFNCKKPGHRRYECPELQNDKNRTDSRPNNYQKHGVNAIDLVENEITYFKNNKEDAGIFIVEKRNREDESEKRELKETKKQKDLSWKQNNEELEILAKKGIKIKRKLTPKIALEVEPYSLKNDLSEMQPNISMAQLIKASPTLRNELSDLCRKVEDKPINNLESAENRTSNCRSIINVFGKYCWAIMDTGAACSVVNRQLLNKWGIEPDFNTSQMVVTADGARHVTYGKASQVPITIAEYTFPADLIIMDRSDEFLVLGTDWFVKNNAKIDLQSM
ncbi:hypothetical protein BB560_006123, partial [Smittium megazygosporum]